MQTSTGTWPLLNHARISGLLLHSCVSRNPSTNVLVLSSSLVLPTTSLLPIQCVCGGLEANELGTLLSELQLSALNSSGPAKQCQRHALLDVLACTGIYYLKVLDWFYRSGNFHVKNNSRKNFRGWFEQRNFFNG